MHIAPTRDFVPKPPQRRLVEFMHTHPGFNSIGKLCQAAGVPRSSY